MWRPDPPLPPLRLSDLAEDDAIAAAGSTAASATRSTSPAARSGMLLPPAGRPNLGHPLRRKRGGVGAARSGLSPLRQAWRGGEAAGSGPPLSSRCGTAAGSGPQAWEGGMAARSGPPLSDGRGAAGCRRAAGGWPWALLFYWNCSSRWCCRCCYSALFLASCV